MKTYNFQEFADEIKNEFVPEFTNVEVSRDCFSLMIEVKLKNQVFRQNIDERELINLHPDALKYIPNYLKQKFIESLN